MITLKSLTHDLTPFDLIAINQEIETLLQAQESDTLRISELVDQRHTVVISLLTVLPDNEKQAFAKAEIPINDYLNTFIGAMFKESGDMLFNLKKGRRAIKHYQQV